MEWSPTKLTFSIDGTLRKTWSQADHNGNEKDEEEEEGIALDKWPQKPMRVKIGAWAVDQDSDEGTVAWAGGLPTWDSGPFRAYVRKVEIEDAAGYCEGGGSSSGDEGGIVDFVLDERVRVWEDVDVGGCEKRDGSGGEEDTDSSSSIPYALVTSTKGAYPPPPGATTSSSGSSSSSVATSPGTTAADATYSMASPTGSTPGAGASGTETSGVPAQETGGKEGEAAAMRCLSVASGFMAIFVWAMML